MSMSYEDIVTPNETSPILAWWRLQPMPPLQQSPCESPPRVWRCDAESARPLPMDSSIFRMLGNHDSIIYSNYIVLLTIIVFKLLLTNHDYPLVNIQKTDGKITIFNGKIHMAMLNYQRVIHDWMKKNLDEYGNFLQTRSSFWSESHGMKPMAFLTQSLIHLRGWIPSTKKCSSIRGIIPAGIESLVISIGHIPIFVQKTPNWSVAEKNISS